MILTVVVNALGGQVERPVQRAFKSAINAGSPYRSEVFLDTITNTSRDKNKDIDVRAFERSLQK